MNYPNFSKCSFFNSPVEKNKQLMKRIETLEMLFEALNKKVDTLTRILEDDDHK